MIIVHGRSHHIPRSHLFSPVDDVLGVVETAGAGPADDRMVARGCVGDPDGSELLHRFTKGYTTQQDPSEG